MSSLKNALLDVEIAHGDLKTSREQLAAFQAENAYTRGGSYPKKISLLKTELAQTIIRLHKSLVLLGLTEVPARDVKVSRRVTINARPNSAEMFTLRRRNTHA